MSVESQYVLHTHTWVWFADCGTFQKTLSPPLTGFSGIRWQSTFEILLARKETKQYFPTVCVCSTFSFKYVVTLGALEV